MCGCNESDSPLHLTCVSLGSVLGNGTQAGQIGSPWSCFSFPEQHTLLRIKQVSEHPRGLAQPMRASSPSFPLPHKMHWAVTDPGSCSLGPWRRDKYEERKPASFIPTENYHHTDDYNY